MAGSDDKRLAEDTAAGLTRQAVAEDEEAGTLAVLASSFAPLAPWLAPRLDADATVDAYALAGAVAGSNRVVNFDAGAAAALSVR